MKANSPSEAVWQILHQATALLREGGFAEPAPPLPATALGSLGQPPLPAEGYSDLAVRYGEHLSPGAWTAGLGAAQPLGLILTEAPLSHEALAFVRSWFENPKVNLTLAEHFFVQPLPTLTGDRPPYAALARDLCTLFRPKALLSLGPVPAQRLLGAPLSLDSLRSTEYRFDRWSLVTTLDPEAFSAVPEEDKSRFKAQVWKDLQRLLGKLRYG